MALEPVSAAPATKIEYTCPMHPEIVRDTPGNCPICGMALEPEMPSEHEDDSEILRVRNKFWLALALSAPIVLIAMLPHLFDLGLTGAAAHWLRRAELLLAVPVVLWAALDYYRRGWMGVVNRSPNMYTLIGLGVLVAFGYSVVATFISHSLPLYFEAAAVITGMNQYKGGKGHDRQVYLKLWAQATIRVDRKNNPDGAPVVVYRPFVAICGGIQPGVVDRLRDAGRPPPSVRAHVLRRRARRLLPSELPPGGERRLRS